MQFSEIKMEIAHLFNRIAPHYDFLNHFLSLGIDKSWRRKAIRRLSNISDCEILDVATGTGDFAFEALKQGAKKIVGIDISEEMLKLAIRKNEQKYNSDKVSFQMGSSSEIAFPDESFDAVTVAFGVRNFAQARQSLHEIFRVLKPNGTLLILEFSMPENFLVASIYKIYFHRFLPLIGSWISGDKQAYHYLPDSVAAFPQSDVFMKNLSDVGFVPDENFRLSGGIAHIYKATKKI